jgi:hypothetical protein
MLWLNGRGPDDRSEQVDAFAFFLAHELHMSVTEVEAMPMGEYVKWNAYFTAKKAVENLRPVMSAANR